MRLVLIRHAEANRGEVPTGLAAPQDLGLTRTGEAQAETLAERLQSTGEIENCTAFLCSPLPRARRTAEILGNGLNLPAVQQERALSEIGNLPGTPATGEPLSAFFARVHQAVLHLSELRAGQTVVAVTHAGWIMASIRVLFDIPTPGTRARFDPHYASITEWSFADGVWRLERYNDAPRRPAA
jgi:broad specificity phosphatase PhoE